MEPIAAFPINGEWDSFGRMLSSEELDFTLQGLGDQYSFPALEPGMNIATPSIFCPNNIPEANFISIADVNEGLFYSLDTLNSNFHYISQENSYSNGGARENYCLSDSDHIPVTNECYSFSTDGLEGLDGGQGQAMAALGKEVELKRKFDSLEQATATEDKTNAMSSDSKKKPRRSRNVEQSKNKSKHTRNGNDVDEIVNGGSQSPSSYSSEEDNASQELVKGENSISKTSGKTRASRGSATDPQSLYARKRRERINERLRILQNLVPNGTKVDLSTMLEEAVHYVKFLQLQIKLLSSDEMWMYAPIAYNGIDIGLHGKISTAL